MPLSGSSLTAASCSSAPPRLRTGPGRSSPRSGPGSCWSPTTTTTTCPPESSMRKRNHNRRQLSESFSVSRILQQLPDAGRRAPVALVLTEPGPFRPSQADRRPHRPFQPEERTPGEQREPRGHGEVPRARTINVCLVTARISHSPFHAFRSRSAPPFYDPSKRHKPESDPRPNLVYLNFKVLNTVVKFTTYSSTLSSLFLLSFSPTGIR